MGWILRDYPSVRTDFSNARDLQRDPRFALHSGSGDPPGWTGDAKLAGVAEEVTDPERVRAINGPKAPAGPSHLFRLDLREASTVSVDGDAGHSFSVPAAWRRDAAEFAAVLCGGRDQPS